MSAEELYDSLGDWKSMVDVLFEKKEDNPYYQACLNEDLEEAKKLIKEGYYAENTYLWIETYGSPCDMECECECGMKPVYHITNETHNMGFNVFAKLYDYGLIPIEYLYHNRIYCVKLLVSADDIEWFLNNREFLENLFKNEK